MSRLEKTVGARSVLLLLIITVLLKTVFTLGANWLVDAQAFNQPEIYYAFTMLQEFIMFGIPLFVFVYLFHHHTKYLCRQLVYRTQSIGTVVRKNAGFRVTGHDPTDLNSRILFVAVACY